MNNYVPPLHPWQDTPVNFWWIDWKLSDAGRHQLIARLITAIAPAASRCDDTTDRSTEWRERWNALVTAKAAAPLHGGWAMTHARCDLLAVDFYNASPLIPDARFSLSSPKKSSVIEANWINV